MKTPNAFRFTLLQASERRVALLVLCQALFVCASAIGLTLTGLVGSMLAPSRALATLPYALVTVATALSTVPVSLLARRWGRPRVFQLGALAGACGGALASWAIVRNDFLLFCTANLALGAFAASAQFYRFAATEAASATFKAQAIGWVTGGGVLAAVLGPTLAALAREAVPGHSFAGSYLAVVALALLSILVLSRLRGGTAAPVLAAGAPTPLLQLLHRPAFLVAACGCAVGAASMMFVMTATPLAVVGCGLPVTVAAGVIQWHLMSMYAPGFFSGRLIARWGVTRALWLGSAAMAGGSLVALSGQSAWQFGLALMLNGAGWNFMFVGGSALLAETFAHDSLADRTRAQAANEFLVAAIVAIAAMASGWVFDGWGWGHVNGLIWPLLALAAGSALWLQRRQDLTLDLTKTRLRRA
ncbi:MFS transporter [Paucibacter sediminis]|uniref:MFS transporter n=1 Tax=Paucibacter sediminis TaxID=3019553 RepID=A0AA95STU3_9BURK|nr:MFS transporter [Paucibacter sp. S2-9]WIT09739.1 MFS transporter [Paucibacter sp. S2-9]